MIELRVRISDCDISGAVEEFLPELMEGLQSSGDLNPILKMACKSPKASAKIVGGIISAMPQRSQEQVLVRLLNSNKALLVDNLLGFAREHSIRMQVEEASAAIL